MHQCIQLKHDLNVTREQLFPSPTLTGKGLSVFHHLQALLISSPCILFLHVLLKSKPEPVSLEASLWWSSGVSQRSIAAFQVTL